MLLMKCKLNPQDSVRNSADNRGFTNPEDYIFLWINTGCYQEVLWELAKTASSLYSVLAYMILPSQEMSLAQYFFVQVDFQAMSLNPP